MILRPYQADALFDVLSAFASGARRVLLVLPTGGGKTVCFSALAEQEPETTAIVAHRRELIRQASGKLTVPHGIIAPGYPQTMHRIQVASVQTAVRRRANRPFGLIILDEAHHAVAGSWRKFLDMHPDARVLGVTATPERLDGRGLGDMFDVLIIGPSPADLVAGGYLSPVRVFAPNTVDLSGVRTLAGDFDAGQAAAVMDKAPLIGDSVAHYARHCDGQPAVAFCASVSHAEHVAEAFRAAGYRSQCVHGGQAVAERDAAIAGLGNGRVDVLTSCDLISEGLDVPAVGAVLLMRPTQSLSLYLQMVGRGMRPAEGKTHLTVLDHAGNVLRHGMPDAAREWTLAGRKKKDRTAPAVRQCPECFAAHAPAKCCPACGHEYATGTATRERQPESAEGELIEVKDILPPLKEQLKAANSYDDIEAIRKQRGYKAGWTRAVMAHKRFNATPYTTAAEDFTDV